MTAFDFYGALFVVFGPKVGEMHPNFINNGQNSDNTLCKVAVAGDRERLMNRIALTANYLGGVILAAGMLCLGLSMPKPGWKALREQLPNWLTSVEDGSIAVVLGVLMMALGKAGNWGQERPKQVRRAPASPLLRQFPESGF